MATRHLQVQPVCVAVGGRAGVGRSTLVDALVGRMAGLGPLTIGELPASNDPTVPAAGARADEPPKPDIPIDIAVHMVLRALQDSDRRAIDGHHRRGIPVLGVLARADTTPDCWAVAGSCAELPLLPVGFGGGELGVAELVECLSAGVGEILAGRADRRLAEIGRAAVEGGADGRDRLERLLAGPEGRRLRMTGAANWDGSAGSAQQALAAAARWRAHANSATDPAEAERARNWHRRHVAVAVRLGEGGG